MSNLLNLLSQQLSPEVVQAIGKSAGLNPQATKGVITSALPLLMGALTNNTQSPQGASSLFNALNKKHDGSVFNNLGDLIQQPERGQGNGILNHIFGGKKQAVEQTVGQANGANAAGASKILQMLAPMVLGMLGKQQRSQGLDVGGLASLLLNSNKQFTREAPQEMGAVKRLLDSDGDGKILDDVAGIGMKLLGSFLRR